MYLRQLNNLPVPLALQTPSQVYYASSCYAPITEMMTGMLKYVYDMSSQDTALTLFVSAGAYV